MEQVTENLRRQIVDSKDYDSRNFAKLTGNFYLVKAALRYYSVKKNMSFTSSKVSKDFPLPVSTAGSALKVLRQLDVVETRTESSSGNRYMPDKVDLERLEQIEQILLENREIESF